MSTVGDIKARFEAAMQLNEKVDLNRKWFSALYGEYTNDIKYSSREIAQKSGESLRADISMDPIEMLGNMLIFAGLEPGSFNIEVMYPGDDGSLSGQYLTIRLNINSTYQSKGANLIKGNSYYIVNATASKNGVKAIINKKDTTPDRMEITKSSYTTVESLISACSTYINNTTWPSNYKNYLIDMMVQISNQTSYKKMDKVEEIIAGNTYQINFDKNLIEKYEIDQASVNNIANDFGEVLGGIFMFSTIKTPGSGVSYPVGSNAALVDFYFDGWSISSKAGKRGGVPSITSIASVIMHKYDTGVLQTEFKELELIQNVISVINNPVASHLDPKSKRQSDVFSTYIALSNKYLNSKNSGYSYFLDKTGLNPNALSRVDIVEKIKELYNNGTFWKIMSEYWSMTGSKPQGYNNENSGLVTFSKADENHILGTFFYPLTVELVSDLNNQFSSELSTLVNKVSTVQQLYLITNPKSNFVTFKFKSFSNANFKFMAGASTNNPLNKNIALLSL